LNHFTVPRAIVDLLIDDRQYYTDQRFWPPTRQPSCAHLKKLCGCLFAHGEYGYVGRLLGDGNGQNESCFNVSRRAP
jgi:hypothetical protein